MAGRTGCEAAPRQGEREDQGLRVLVSRHPNHFPLQGVTLEVLGALEVVLEIAPVAQEEVLEELAPQLVLEVALQE